MKDNAIIKAIIGTFIFLSVIAVGLCGMALFTTYAPEWLQLTFMSIGMCWVVAYIFGILYKHYRD